MLILLYLMTVSVQQFVMKHSMFVKCQATNAGSGAKVSLFPIHKGGPAESVANIVVIGEAYVDETVFQSDSRRLVMPLWNGQGAYATIAPISSVWGLFVESKSNTIGAQGQPLDTALKLFREADAPLRSILPTDGFTYQEAKRLCKEHVPFKADYIVILAHDVYYGGLGDDIAIVSSSSVTGQIGLRHELGHNFADIGEEYDGGEDYSGANFALTRRLCREGEGPRTVPVGGGVVRNVWPCISWGKWLSVPMLPGGDVVDEEKASLLLALWPWYKFNENVAKPDTKQFTFYCSGDATEFNRVRIVLSTAGIRKPYHEATSATPTLRLKLDDTYLDLQLPLHGDRHFQTIEFEHILMPGRHTVSFEHYGGKARGVYSDIPPPLLCHVMVYRLGVKYHSAGTSSMKGDHVFVGAFPVFSAAGKLKGYRPTDRMCMMRNMESSHMCPVCRELVWRSIAKRSQFVFGASYKVSRQADARLVSVNLELVSLGAYSKHEPQGRFVRDEKLDITWHRYNHKSMQHIPTLDGKASWDLPASTAVGCWGVRADLWSPHLSPTNSKRRRLQSKTHPDLSKTTYLYIDPESLSDEIDGKYERAQPCPTYMLPHEESSYSKLRPFDGGAFIGKANTAEKERDLMPLQSTKSRYFWMVVCLDITVFCTAIYNIVWNRRGFCVRRKLMGLFVCMVVSHMVLLFVTIHARVAMKLDQSPPPRAPLDFLSLDHAPLPPVAHSSPKLIGDAPFHTTSHGHGRTGSSTVAKAGVQLCRYTRENPHVAVDDHGAVCSRHDIDSHTGCCKTKDEKESLKSGCGSAATCDPRTMCCTSFEACVSCCMQSLVGAARANGSTTGTPNKRRELLEQRFQNYGVYAGEKKTLLGVARFVKDVGVKVMKHPDCFKKEDPFRMCSCKCRTHSQTLRHENMYKTAFHFCHYEKPPPRPIPDIRVGKQGESCTSVCSRSRSRMQSSSMSKMKYDDDDDGSDYICDDIDLRYINTCESLRKHMKCEKGCESTVGGDQPCLVVSPTSDKVGKCLFQGNAQYFSCSGRHDDTARLCPCQKKFF